MWKKIVAGSALVVVLAAVSLWYFIDHRIRSAIDIHLEQAVENGPYEELYYEDFSYGLDGSASMGQLHVKLPGIAFILDRVNFTELVYEGEVPRQIRLQVSDVVFPDGLPDLSQTRLAGLQNLLARSMQDNTLPLQLEYSHHYDPAMDFQVDSVVMLAIEGLMQLDFNSSMRNIPLEELSGISQAQSDELALQSEVAQLISRGEFPSLSISLQDEGLVQAYMENSAANFAVTADDYRKMLVSQARNLYLFLPQSAQGLGMTAGIQLASFLEGGKTLTLSLQPEFNGSIAKLQPQLMGALLSGDYTRMVELLKLELETR